MEGRSKSAGKTCFSNSNPEICCTRTRKRLRCGISAYDSDVDWWLLGISKFANLAASAGLSNLPPEFSSGLSKLNFAATATRPKLRKRIPANALHAIFWRFWRLHLRRESSARQTRQFNPRPGNLHMIFG
ncbi:hypothetical protein ACFX15_035162 [Malus domestica]